ncbi:MAG: TonB-dependent receptor [candidate division Zixibacteria bacterium]|nr:TonB-dependent receptor [candidate division Zixibacteria bacterium]
MKAALVFAGCLYFGAAFCFAQSAPVDSLEGDSLQVSDSLKKPAPLAIITYSLTIPVLSVEELLSSFSSPIKLGREETDLYNPEDLAALLFLKPSIDVFSLGPFGQKRGFSNWGRIGRGEELLYDGQPHAPVYLNYPQSSEADLTSLQFEQVDSVSFFDHPLLSFLSGTQAPASIHLHRSTSGDKQSLVSARLKKGIENGSPFSSSRQTTAVFDLQRPLGKKAFARGIGSFRTNDTTDSPNRTEVQSYHLSMENPAGSKNRWKGGYELDRELGKIVSFDTALNLNLDKNFRRDAFFFSMDGQLTANTKIEADLRYQRTDQKITPSSSEYRRRVEERRPYFGLALSRELSRSFLKLYGNAGATILNQHPGRADDWQVRLGTVWAAKLDDKTIFSVIGQFSETHLESPKPEGWVGLARSLGAHQTVFVTVSSQVIYPSVFDRFFEPKTLTSYTELSNSGPPERGNRINFTYKIETRRFAGGFSLVAERSDNYLVWESITGPWQPTFRDVEGGGVESGFDLKFLGEWKGGYALKSIRNRVDKVGLPLSAQHRAYLRWTTPEVKPIKALSFRLVPIVHYFSAFDDDFNPSTLEQNAVLVNIKAIGAVKNFDFFYAVENLFDRQYFLRGSLPQPGRSYFFGFNWHLWN